MFDIQITTKIKILYTIRGKTLYLSAQKLLRKTSDDTAYNSASVSDVGHTDFDRKKYFATIFWLHF